MRRAAGGSDLGALGQIMTLSERESRRVVRLLSTVTAGFTDGARDDPDVESAALRSMGDTSP
jgi:hypothetical protein